jgi:hypothetical protein
MLAQALFLTKYMKHSMNEATKEKAETAWLARWRTHLNKPTCTPQTVMRAYLDTMDMTVEDLDGQLCWDCWTEDDKPFAELDLQANE